MAAGDPTSDNQGSVASDKSARRPSDKAAFSDIADRGSVDSGVSTALAVQSPPASSSGSLNGILADAELRADAEGAYSFNTMRAYRADWADWTAWCARRGCPSLPAEPRALRDYLVDLASSLKLSTIRRRLAAIARAHKLAAQPLDRLDPVVYHALRRLGREQAHAPAGRAEVMTADIAAMLKHVRPGIAGLQDRAVLLLGYAGGVRRSELVALELPHDIEWKRDGILLKLRRSKGDQLGRGQEVAVAYGKHEATCPVRALKKWLQGSGISSGPLFRAVEHGRIGAEALSDKAVYRLVKRLAEAAGLDPAPLGAHSLRVGHVTQARANGALREDAQRQLRHKRAETTEGYDRGKALRSTTSSKLGL